VNLITDCPVYNSGPDYDNDGELSAYIKGRIKGTARRDNGYNCA